MAIVVEISNPFNPLQDTRTTEVSGTPTVREWLVERFGPDFVDFPTPTVCLVNGKPLLRSQWGTTSLLKTDVVNFVSCPGAQVAYIFYWIAIILMAVSIVMMLTMKTDTPQLEDAERGDSVYNITGKTNQLKLNKPIESPYGKCRLYPSYGAMPFSYYSSNDQWLCELFSLGHGEFDIHSILIEDTPIGDYTNVQYQVIPPGGAVTLFPDNVVNSSEVQNIELFAPNEGKTNGEWIEVSEELYDPYDETWYPHTRYQGYNVAGPFTVVPVGELATVLEFDYTLPQGLYYTKDDGKLTSLSVTFKFEYRQLDDSNNPIGDWQLGYNLTMSMATLTPQRRTAYVTVPAGRYQVRAARTSDKDTTTRAGNTLMWEAVRAVLPSKKTYPLTTMLAVKARATSNLNNNAARRVNVWATRKLPVWTGSAWSARTATRNPVWAACDILKSAYGGVLPDAYLNLTTLKSLADAADTRGDTFDYIFDRETSLWEAVRVAMAVIRAVPIVNGSQISAVRDEPKTLPVAVFNPENMVENTFRYALKFRSSVTNDGLLVTYVDPVTFLQETVLCCLPDEAGTNPEQVTLHGCTSRAQAYYWGMWRRSCQRLQRRNVSFTTGREGHIPSFGDMISVTHDLPRWGKSGLVVSISGTTLTLSEPVDLSVGGPYKIMLRKKNGDATAPVTVTQGSDPYKVVSATAFSLSDFYFDSRYEAPLFNIGPSVMVGKYIVVTNLSPVGEDQVELSGIPYNSNVWNYDGTTVPPKGQTEGNLSLVPDLPTISLLQVKASRNPGEVLASWNPAPGAKSYNVERSYDLLAWETIAINYPDTSVAFPAEPGVNMYVRVAALTTDWGPWVAWHGSCPAFEQIDLPATGSLVANPGFEDLLRNWFATNTVLDSNVKLGGSQSAQLGATTGVLLSQAFPVIPGVKYKVRVSHRAVSAATLTVSMRSQAGYLNPVSGGTVTALGAPAVTSTWATSLFVFTPPAGHFFASLELKNTSGVAVNVDLIDVFTDTDITPPAAPTGFSSQPASVAGMPAIGAKPSGLLPMWLGCVISWTKATEADFSHYETWAYYGTSTQGGGGPVAYPAAGTFGRHDSTKYNAYNSTTYGFWLWVRAVDLSGNTSAWVNTRVGGYGTSQMDAVSGSMTLQNSDNVKSSGISVGAAGASSVRKVLAEYVVNQTFTVTAGQNYFQFNVDLTGRGFSTKPDNCAHTFASWPGNTRFYYVYDDAGSTSTNAVMRFETLDYSNFTEAPYRVCLTFTEYD